MLGRTETTEAKEEKEASVKSKNRYSKYGKETYADKRFFFTFVLSMMFLYLWSFIQSGLHHMFYIQYSKRSSERGESSIYRCSQVYYRLKSNMMRTKITSNK